MKITPTFKKLFTEAIKKLSDEAMDKELKGKTVKTYPFNQEAVFELGKTTDVYVTKDKKFFHIEPSESTSKIINTYKLKEV